MLDEKNPMMEARLNRIQISDFDAETVQLMLNFMYLEEVTPDFKRKSEDLLRIAEKYDFSGLKAAVQKLLFDNLTVENAAHTLDLADRHNAKELKHAALEFING